jgi:hypothetical protein
VFSYTCGLAIFNFEVVFEKFQTVNVNELETNEYSSISSTYILYVDLAIKIVFLLAASTFLQIENRKLACALKMSSRIYSS